MGVKCSAGAATAEGSRRRHWRGGAGRAKACRLAWGLPLCVTKALSVCTLKDPLVCRHGHRWGGLGPSLLPISSQGNFSDGPPTASLSRCPKRLLLRPP